MSEQNNASDSSIQFSQLNLSAPVQAALDEIGYDTPSPIQAKAIPHLLDGRDVIGQAQTGTGKTAAFALPLLSVLDPKEPGPQALILAPTRELALQVAEAIAKYGSKIRGLSVTAIYGGSDFNPQFRALRSNPTIVVGTPGRMMDHINRGSLDLSRIKNVVLDEADEMLRMGFIDDVEWILERTPGTRQTALFSATMPPRIAAIAQKQLREPVTLSIKGATATVSTVRQRFVKCTGLRHKIDALAGLIAVEEPEAAIVFTRTKSAASDLAEALSQHGHAVEAIHGDISQAKRERAVAMLKSGRIDILVATDVAARGLDVDRISHVFNFDIPEDPEPYIHRIGRAGRAGRSGDAITLVTNRDVRRLRDIERGTRHTIEAMAAPTRADIEAVRLRKLQAELKGIIEAGSLKREQASIEKLIAELDTDATTLAAALLQISAPSKPMAAGASEVRATSAKARPAQTAPRARDLDSATKHRRVEDFQRDRPRVLAGRDKRSASPAASTAPREGGSGPVERYRIEVGHQHRVKPGNIVGAIANEAGLEGRHIGQIDIFDTYSTIDLPIGMPREVLNTLKKTWVAGQQMRMRKIA